MTIQHSTVKWFDAKKGYGFINHPDGGDDVFIHYSQIDSDDDFKTLRTGQSVQFEMNDGPKGLHAVNVRALDDETSPMPTEESDASVDATAPETGTFGEPAEADTSVQPRPDRGTPDEGGTPTF
jgi:CspA family cold shock protein